MKNVQMKCSLQKLFFRLKHAGALFCFLFCLFAVTPYGLFADDGGDSGSGDDSVSSEGSDNPGGENPDSTEDDDDPESKKEEPEGSPDDDPVNELEAYLAAYEEALALVEAVLEGEVDMDVISFEQLVEYCDEQKDTLDNYCEEHDYSYTTDEWTGDITVYNAAGEIVNNVGDPVMLATGLFRIDDKDIGIRVGKHEFEFVRHYVSKSNVADITEDGKTGKPWTTVLDSRIILGGLERASRESVKYQMLINDANVQYAKISQMAERYPDCYRFTGQLNELIVGWTNKMQMMDYVTLQSNQRAQRNVFVNYGLASRLAKNIGLTAVMYVDDYGTPFVYDVVDGEYRTNAGRNAPSLSYNIYADSYTVSYPGGETRIYSGYGLLLSISYADGSTVQFNYTPSAFVYSIVLNSIRTLQCTWENSRLRTISDGSRTIRYTYSDGMLHSVLDEENDRTIYDYDENGLLVEQMKPDGTCVYYGYEIGEDGRIRTSYTINENEGQESFFYDTDTRRTTYVDSDGVRSYFDYDEHGRTIRETYADGNVISYGYDSSGKLAWREKSGERETYAYSGDFLTRVNFNDGSSIQQEYSDGKMVMHKDRDGVRTNFSYDSHGNLTALYRNGEKVHEYSYNDLQLVSKDKDCMGNWAEYTYDTYGNLLTKKLYASESSSPASTESWTYDARDRIVSHTDPLGIVHEYQYGDHRVTRTSSDGFETEVEYTNRKDVTKRRMKDTVTGEERICWYEYDNCHNCLMTWFSGTDGNGTHYSETPLKSYAYSDHGRLRQIIEWNGRGSGWSTWSDIGLTGYVLKLRYGLVDASEKETEHFQDVDCGWKWFSDGGLETSETNGDGRIVTRRFDAWNRLLAIRDGDDFLSQNEYSPEGRLVKSLLPTGGSIAHYYDADSGFYAGTEELGGKGGKTTVWCRPDGKKSMTQDPIGNIIRYSYDVFGNLTKLTSAERTETWEYDAGGRLLNHALKSPTGTVVRQESVRYSADGRTVTFTTGGLYSKTCRRNGFGDIVSIKDAAGNEQRFVYDVRGRCIEAHDAYGKKTLYTYDGRNRLVKKVDRNGAVTQYEYDFDGNCTKITDATGVVFSAAYDKSGRMVERKQVPHGISVAYEYDAKNRLVKTTRAGNVASRTSYGSDGKKIVRIDGKGNATEFVTDGFGRFLSERNRLGISQTFEYNADGTLSKTIDFNGSVTKYSYSRAENTLRVSHADGSFATKTWDPAGNIIAADTEKSQLRFAFDTAGKLTSQTDVRTGEKILFSYDSCGRRTRLKSPKQDVAFQYGKNGELTKLTDSANAVSIQFAYDDMGREILRAYSSGESVSTAYDEAGRVIFTAVYDAAMRLVSLDGSVYDENGARVLSIGNGFAVTRYRYDSAGRLASVQYPYSEQMASHLKTLCDESGALPGQPVSVSSMILRLTSKEYAELSEIAGLARRQNAVPDINSTMMEERFSYDENGNLTGRETPFGTIRYRYDAEDRLSSWGEYGSATYDGNGNLLLRKNICRKENYAYTKENRLKRAVLQDFQTESSCEITCAYDAFGRRNEIHSSLTGAVRTAHDGFSFKDLYAVRSAVAESHETGEPDFRYQFIDDSSSERNVRIPSGTSDDRTPQPQPSSAPVLTDDGYAAVYGNSRVPVSLFHFAPGTDRRTVLFSDSIGTVKAATTGDEAPEHYAYDVLGAQIPSETNTAATQPYGFAGKKSTDVTSFYDFGYRDYSPLASRFTSADPARDGPNWYSYCGGDPVNWVDRLGLTIIPVPDVDMHNSEWSNEKLGNSQTNTIGAEGCTVSGLSQVINVVTDSNLTPKDVNDVKENFKEGTDLIDFGAVGTNYGVTHDYWTAGVQGNLESKINELNNYATEFAVLAQVQYGESKSDLHWVGLNGAPVEIEGKSYVCVSQTSVYDGTLGGSRASVGWRSEEGKVYVPTELVTRLESYERAYTKEEEWMDRKGYDIEKTSESRRAEDHAQMKAMDEAAKNSQAVQLAPSPVSQTQEIEQNSNAKNQ